MIEKPADVHLVCEELKRQDKLKPVGGAAYITDSGAVCRHIGLY